MNLGTSFDTSRMRGYPRTDGRKGIRNYVVVSYLVECAHHVARRIAEPFVDEGAQLIGFPGCYPSDYAHRVLEAMCTHPNVGAVVLVSLGCEEFRRSDLKRTIEASGRPVEVLVIQDCGGTRATVEEGRKWVTEQLALRAEDPTVPLTLADLVIGTKCGGSDGLSGITINPAVGHAFDLLVDRGARLDVKNSRGFTPLNIANGEGNTATFQRRPETVALFRDLMKARGLTVDDTSFVSPTVRGGSDARPPGDR